MFGSILIWFILPWLDKSPVRSANYRPTYRMFFWILMADMAVLFWCGGLPAAEPYVMISQIATAYYFMHFLVIVPLVSRSEKTAPLPNSITDAVLRSEEHTSELQSLMRISYAVFCLK